MHSSDKRKPKTIVSPFYALSGSIPTPNVSRTPSLRKVASAPELLTTTPINPNEFKVEDDSQEELKDLNISSELLPLRKRVMTVPTNLSEYHHPFIVLELLLNLPMECHMGIISDNLKPMIDAAIREQTKLEKQQNIIIEEQIKRIQQTKQQIDEYKEYQPRISPNLLPAAPLAIPPTANMVPNMVPNSIQKRQETNQLQQNYDYIIQPLQRRPSLKQFESVLKEGYTFNLIIAIIQALLGAFLSGYNIAVLNVPSLVIQNECNLNMNKYSSLQTFYCLGGLIGALSIGKISDTFGRKRAIIIFDIIFIISGLLLFFGDINLHYFVFLIGRLICGIGSGISTTIIPIYLGEISPPLIRGAIGTLNQLTVAFGLIIAELLSYHKIFGNEKLWKYLFIINIILPIIQFFTLWTLPESPKWLITKNDENEARKILQYLRECSNVDMDLHFTKLINEFQYKKQNTTTNYGSIPNNNNTRNNKQPICSRICLYSLSIAIYLQILQQFSGINSIFYYSNGTLMNAGFTNPNELWIGNILIVIVNFLSVLIPVYLMDKRGRKYLLNISLWGMIVSCIGFSICLIIYNQYYSIYNINYGYVGIIFLIAYVISFEIGLGPIPWLMCVEITPSKHRAVIVSFATFFNWGANLLIAQFANKLILYLQFFPFAAICFIGWCICKKIIPETKGKTEMQIQQELIWK